MIYEEILLDFFEDVPKRGAYKVMYEDDAEEWFLDGQRHREDGPAIIHRIYSSNEESWYFHGKRHRLDGPAITFYGADGMMSEWWLDGRIYSKEEWEIERDRWVTKDHII